MANYIVRPTSYVSGNFATTNAASNAIVTTNLGDNSDATSVIHNSSSATNWDFGLATASIPSDEFIAKVGGSIRYSGGAFNGVAYTYIGCRAYRTIDGIPSFIPSQASAGPGAPTSIEVGIQNVEWKLSDLSGLRIRWYDSRTSSSTTVTTYDIWATLYTIKNATATPSATTMTSSSTPVIPVAVTATIGFEAGSLDATKLRLVTTEVRVESGGSGAGTGTLITSTTFDTLFTATGTINANVTMPTPITNGTYNIYARSVRYRDSQTTPLTEQYGAWSSAATLTMNVPAPSTPTTAVSGEQNLDRVLITSDAPATTNYTTPITHNFQRSIDGGTTWTTIRGSGVTPSRTNLMRNGHFDVDTASWTAGANTTISRVTAPTPIPQAGAGSLRLVSTAAGTLVTNTAGGTGGMAVAASTAYTYSVYVNSASVGRSVVLAIDWYNAAGTFISTASATAGTSTIGSWTRFSLTNQTSPATAAYAGVSVTISAATGASEVHYLDSVMFERSSTLNTFIPGTQAILYDFEMSRGVTVSYRTSVTAYYTTGSVSNSSAWATGGSTANISAIDWNIKVPENSTLNVIDVNIINDPTEQLTETMGVFRALDRQYPIVVAGTLGGYDGELQILTSNAAEWTSIKALLESQRVLLLESPWGWSKYIRIVNGAQITNKGSATLPRRVITANYVHVQAP